MRHKVLAAAALSIGLLMSSGPTLAHHGGSAYDTSKTVTLTGTVKTFDFIQPHPIIGLDVKDESGNMVNWSIEMTSPNHLVRYGWNGHKLKPGDQITVTGNAAKNGLKVLNLRKIAWSTGEVIPLGPPPEPGQQ
jgi:hypothetical protein